VESRRVDRRTRSAENSAHTPGAPRSLPASFAEHAHSGAPPVPRADTQAE